LSIVILHNSEKQEENTQIMSTRILELNAFPGWLELFHGGIGGCGTEIEVSEMCTVNLSTVERFKLGGQSSWREGRSGRT
jgi:hypothetical protein